MRRHAKQFLSPEDRYCRFETAAVAILPFPFEGGVSYGKGAGRAPKAILDASAFVEFYDEVLKIEPFRIGIVTMAEPKMPKEAEKVLALLRRQTQWLIQQGKFVVIMGGDHSITSGAFRAFKEVYPELGCIQLDAHADLRDEYEGSPFSHACVMARIREMTPHTLQLGIRALSVEEAQRIEKEQMLYCPMKEYRCGSFPLEKALQQLPDPVFITVDVDAFDLSIFPGTGTPEPGGFSWDEGLQLLEKIFMSKNVVGFDVVEVAYSPHDRISAFSAARLIYKMIGFKLAAEMSRGHCLLPMEPKGKIWP